MSILIQNIQHEEQTVDVFIDGNMILKIGDCSALSAETVIDGGNKAILATFHNAHHHAAMATMRGYAALRLSRRIMA